MACNQPQAHPERCGCQQQSMPFTASWGGVTVMLNDQLPAQTMIVSRDLFVLFKSQGPKP